MRTALRNGVSNDVNSRRIIFIFSAIILGFLALIARLFFIQVIAHEKYKNLADQQHLVTADFTAQRGEIYAKDRTYGDDEILYPLAANKYFYEIYLNPSEITRPINTAEVIHEILGVDYDVILARAQKENDIYEPVVGRATEEQLIALRDTGLDGIYANRHVWRYYPDKEVGSHILGFYGADGDTFRGKYGLEGYWDAELAGLNQQVIVARDRSGSLIPEGNDDFDSAIDGSDIILTIDRTIQFEACKGLDEAIDHFGADKGSVIIMESKTGRIRALCDSPSFDPNRYNEVEDLSWFNNDAVFEAYEPGSVFKPISMSIAIDQGVVTPATTYEDTGETTISDFTIRNFDHQAHGLKTMTEVLQESLNLGAIFSTKNVPNSTFFEYIRNFGFGQLSGIDISQESEGSLGKLDTYQDIYKATASFGQGLTATPLQVINAINVIANKGKLLRPFIVDEIRPSNSAPVKTQPKIIRQVITPETADTVTAMLVRVLEEGYDHKGSVDGYYLAGKTGTAQIAENGRYGTKTNHTFVGFGPANDPLFTILIKLNNVKNVGFAADSTTVLYHKLAEFLLNYYKIPPSK